MKPTEVMKSLLLSNKGSLSSKRLCGILGWLVVLIILIGCTIATVEAPELAAIVVYTSAALLGVDSITQVFHREG